MIFPQLARETFRKKSNLVVAALTEAAAPFMALGAKVWSRRTPAPPERWRKGVLVGAGHIGDVLYNTASLPMLKRAFPKCHWYFVAASPADQVLAHNPHLEGVVARLEDVKDADVAICYNSSSYWREAVAAARLGIPSRVGYVHKGFSGLVTLPVNIQYPKPYPAYFRDLVSQLSGCSPDWSLRPRVFPAASDRDTADQVWERLELSVENPVVVCFATSRQPSGVWPAEKFAATVAQVEALSGAQTILCGTASDGRRLHALKEQFGLRAHILAGSLNLLPLACFLERCAGVLCPDSGPRHLANAVGTRVVFVRNFAVGKIETGTYCNTEIDVAPDNERVPPSLQPEAFASLKPESVADTILTHFA